MKFSTQSMRLSLPTGSMFTLFSISDQNGHLLALVNGGSENAVTLTFEDEDAARRVTEALNSPSPVTQKVVGKRKSTGHYQIDTERGVFDVEIEKDGDGSTWQVVLPTGETLDQPFKTKREALAAVAGMV